MAVPSLQVFHEQQTKTVVNFWYNSKKQRIHEHKKRKMRAEQVAKPKRVCVAVNELSSPL